MKQWGIKSRVILLTVLPTLSVALLLSIFFINIRMHVLDTNMRYESAVMAYQLAPKALYGTYTKNKNDMQIVTDAALIQYNRILSAAIYTPDVKLQVYTGDLPKVKPGQLATLKSQYRNGAQMQHIGNDLLVIKPILFEPINVNKQVNYSLPQSFFERTQLVGWLVLKISGSEKILKEYQAISATILITLIGFAISIILGLWLGRYITTPLLDITRTVERLKEGHFDSRVSVNTSGEFSILKTGINRMADALGLSHEQMQKNIDQATAELRQAMDGLAQKNQALDEARQEALQASKIKSQFLANMSHEIRTPMNGIIGFTELLQKTKLNKEQQDYLHTIHASAQSLLSIINEVLDFSKIEAGKVTVKPEPINFRETIEGVLKLMAPLAYKKHIELGLMFYADVPEYILADPMRLRQIIINLVDNAIKFTENGHVTIRVIQEQLVQGNALLKVTIEDTGVGMDAAIQAELFKPFTQADTSASRRHGGTGLGLVISKGLVEKMHGDIGVVSTPQKGSSFWFTFECRYQAEQPTAVIEGLERLRILVCESHTTTRLSILQLLEGMGATVDATQTLEEISPTQGPYDLILLHVNETDNKKVLIQRIKPVRKAKTPLIVMMNASDESVKQFIRGNHYCYGISKPLIKSRLLSAIAQACGLKYTSQDTSDKPKLITRQRRQSGNVLAVDDHPANLKLVKILLEEAGLNVMTATSGQQAIDLCKQQPFDMVLMDIQMPGMNGVEATQQIRLLQLSPRPTIVALTADVMEGQRQKLLQQGFDDYQSKPLRFDKLQTLLEKWLRHQTTLKSQKQAQTTEISSEQMPIIDLDLGKSLAGGNEKTARDMLTLLAKSLPEDLENLTQAFALHDDKTLQSVIHRIHGAACYCGTPALKQAARQLEHALKTKASQASINADYENATVIINKTLTAIQNL